MRYRRHNDKKIISESFFLQWADTKYFTRKFSKLHKTECSSPFKFFLEIGNKSRRFYERLLCDITLSWYYTIRRTYKYGRNVFLFKKIEWAEI